MPARLIIALLAAVSTAAGAFGRLEEVVHLPGPDGRTLTATVYRPEGGAQHPLIVLSHGSPPNAAMRPAMDRYRILTVTFEAVTDSDRYGFVQDMDRLNGISTDVLFVINPTSANPARIDCWQWQNRRAARS